MAPAKYFLAATVFFLQFWASFLTVFKSLFFQFGSLFTSKTNLSDAPKQFGEFSNG
jgi:hypothetical protein